MVGGPNFIHDSSPHGKTWVHYTFTRRGVYGEDGTEHKDLALGKWFNSGEEAGQTRVD